MAANKQFIITFCILVLGATYLLVKNQGWTEYRSVGIVKSMDQENGQIVSGTVFAIDRDDLITAGHVCRAIDLDDQTFIQYLDRNNKPVTIDGVVKIQIYDKDDLCLITAPNHGLYPVSIDFRAPKLRSDITVIGAPYGLGVGEYSGKVMDNNHLMAGGKTRIMISAHSTRGMSGAPVFHNKKVVCVQVSVLRSFSGVGMCVGTKSLLNFLNEVD